MLFAEESSQRRAHCGIGEGLLDQCLAVIEAAAHREAQHVIAPAAQLLLLGRGDLSLGEQHHAPRCRLAVEGGGDRTARVAGSRHQQLAAGAR